MGKKLGLLLVLFAGYVQAQQDSQCNRTASNGCTDVAPVTAAAKGTALPQVMTADDIRGIYGGVADAVTFGADPSGAKDSTAAIRAAANSNLHGQHPAVYLPAGNYLVSDTITLNSGQCLYGDTMNTSQVIVSPNFTTSATSVFTWSYSAVTPAAQWRDQANSCIHDLAIIGVQPSGEMVNAVAWSGTRLLVDRFVPVNYYINDVTAPAAIPHRSYIKVTAVSGTGPYALTLSRTPSGKIAVGDRIAANAARSSYQLTGSCTTTATTGTGCRYPTFIDTANKGGRLWNLILAGAWNCVNSGAAGGLWMHTIRCGSLSVGWHLDGATDFIFVNDWESHAHWGLNTTGGYGIVDSAREDGLCVGWQLGRADGILADTAGFFDCGITATSNSTRSLGEWQWTNFWLDNDNTNILLLGNQKIQLTNLVKSGESQVDGVCPIDVRTGTLRLINAYFEMGSTASTAEVCINGGTVSADQGRFWNTSSRQPVFTEASGSLSIFGSHFISQATLSAAAVLQTGGIVRLIGNVADAGKSGSIFSVSVDNPASYVAANSVPGYTITIPAGTLAGYYADASKIYSGLAVTTNSGNALSVIGSPSTDAATVTNHNATGSATTLYENNESKELAVGVGGSSSGMPDAHVATVTREPLYMYAGLGKVFAVNPDKTVQLIERFTVSRLPQCNSAEKGAFAYVTDAKSPTYNGALSGGGSVVVPVFCNGSAWTSH